MNHARLVIWDDGECRRVYEAALAVLAKTGVEIKYDPALALLSAAGARVDGTRARLDEPLVAQALASAPRTWTLRSRGRDQGIELADGAGPYYGTGPDCIYTRDPDTGERRRGLLADVEAMAAFQEKLPNIDFVMSMTLPDDASTDVSQFAAMLAGTRKPLVMSSAQSGEHLRAMHEMATLCGEAASFACLTMSSAPLSHDGDALSKAMVCAELGIPLISASAPSAGATAPCTVTSGIVTGLAETLSALVIHQLTKPGAPFVSGVGVAVLDLRTAADNYVTPECFSGMQACTDLNRYFGLPSWSYSGVSDSKVQDEQQAADSAITTVLGSLSRATMLHDVGYCEMGMQSSYESMTIGDELAGFARAFMRDVPVDDEALALDEIDAVGPGGNHLNRPYTRKHHRSFWRASLFDHTVYDRWAANGSQTMGERLKAKVAELRAQPREFVIDKEVRTKLSRIAVAVEEEYQAAGA